MKRTAKRGFWLFLMGTLGSVLAMPMARGGDAPILTSLRPGDGQITVTVAVADWVKQLTLESRTNVESGTWLRRAWQPVTSAATITFQLDSPEAMAFFHARAYDTPGFLDRVGFGLSLIRMR